MALIFNIDTYGEELAAAAKNELAHREIMLDSFEKQTPVENQKVMDKTDTIIKQENDKPWR